MKYEWALQESALYDILDISVPSDKIGFNKSVIFLRNPTHKVSEYRITTEIYFIP